MLPSGKIYLKQNLSGHPWIYGHNIAGIDPGITPGDIVRVLSRSNQSVIGIGYYNPKSKIPVRLLTANDEPIDGNFFVRRISEAISKRSDIKKATDAYRVVSGEGDYLPGIIADLYNDTLVLQLTTLGADRMKQTVIDAFRESINPAYMYEKSDMQSRQMEGLKPATGWHGKKGSGSIKIREGNARFIVDILNGHKTGFYLDQRRSRLSLNTISGKKRTLDVSCYTGGFAVHAAINGASEVTGVDIKDDWLRLAEENTKINNVSDKVRFVKGDAFKVLQDMAAVKNYFDLIIVDPPSFTKNKYKVRSALKGYLELNRLAMRLLNDDGILCTFSCSHHINNNLFSDMIKKAAELEHKEISILRRCHQDKDHPILKEIPETDYLKGYFLLVKDR